MSSVAGGSERPARGKEGEPTGSRSPRKDAPGGTKRAATNRAQQIVVEDPKPTQSELEEAALLISASGQHIEEQLYYQVVSDEVESEEVAEADQQPAEPQPTDEELKVQLQELLDSQLTGDDGSGQDRDAKYLLGKRSDVFANNDEEPQDDMEAENPNKGFTSNEIQAFMNNQIRKHHQHTALQEDIDQEHQQRAEQEAEVEEPQQQHLILVTQNGDKIILIQNPSDVETVDENGMPVSDYDINTQYQQGEIKEEEEQQIQLQTKMRQASLMSSLPALRKKHQDTLHSSVTTPAIPHLQPIELRPLPMKSDLMTEVKNLEKDDNPEHHWKLGLTGFAKQQSKFKRKPFKMPKNSGVASPKWLKPVTGYLQVAQNYVKRREHKIDEVAKLFPSASTSFENRCADMKQDFLRIELIVERFRNAIGNDLEEVTFKFKQFMNDYHLDAFVGEIEAEDEMDDFDEATYDNEEPTFSKSSSPTKTDLKPEEMVVDNEVEEEEEAADVEDDQEPETITPEDVEQNSSDARGILESMANEKATVVTPVKSTSKAGVKPGTVLTAGSTGWTKTRVPESPVATKSLPVASTSTPEEPGTSTRSTIRSARIQQQLHVEQAASSGRKRAGRPAKKRGANSISETDGNVLSAKASKPVQATTPSSFKCHVQGCSKFFLTASKLQEHANLVHGSDSNVVYQCPIEGCERTFNSTKALQTHQRSVHNLGHYECTVCTFKNKTKAQLEAHVKKLHPSVYSKELFEDGDEEGHQDVYTFRDAEEEDEEESVTNVDIDEASGSTNPVVSPKRETRSKKKSDVTNEVNSNWQMKVRGKPPKASAAKAAPTPQKNITAVELVPENEDEEQDDNDIIKELGSLQSVDSSKLFAPVGTKTIKTPTGSSASSPRPARLSAVPGSGVNGKKREQDEISLECRSDCNFSAIDESSNAETFRTESPLDLPLEPQLTTPVATSSTSSRTAGHGGSGAVTRSGRPNKAPKWDSVMKSTRTTRRQNSTPVVETPSKKPKTIHV